MKFNPLDLISFNSFRRSWAWADVRAFFNPRQKWLTKQIPKTWCDKTELVPLVLFAILIDFVESEKGCDQLNVDWSEDIAKGYVTPEYVDSVKRIYSELLEVYHYAKTGRAALQKALDESYPEIDITSKTPWKTEQPYEIAYAETNRLEKLIEEKDQWAMTTIIKHVGVLWT